MSISNWPAGESSREKLLTKGAQNLSDAELLAIFLRTGILGTIDGASVHPREVAKQALYHSAVALIFAHNHPSGVAEPSRADISITQRLKRLLEEVDIRTLDHLIVGDGEVNSLAEKGLL